MLSGFCPARFWYCYAVWCSTANTYLKLLDRVVGGARILIVCVFECDISHRRSVAVLSVFYKNRCNPMNPLYCTCSICAVCASVGCTRVVHRYILVRLHSAEPRSTTRFLFPSQCLRETILLTLHSMAWG